VIYAMVENGGNEVSLAPSGIQQTQSADRWPQPMARLVTGPDAPIMVPPHITAPVSESNQPPQPAPPELDLTKFIAQLTRQLKQIEQTFMRALQSLVREVEAGSLHVAQPSNQARQTSNTTRPSAYDGLIRRTARRHELDPALLSAVIRQESDFDPNARSRAGAMGLMQLMPDTARSLGVTDPYDPAQNVEGGARMLRGLIDRYGGRLDLALAAYNAGSGAVDKYDGVPPFAETRSYVHSILGEYRANALSV